MKRFTQLFDPHEEVPRAGFWLRKLRSDAELDAVIELERRSYHHPWSEDLVRREAENEWATILVALHRGDDEEQLVGFVIFWVIYEEIHILNIAVEFDWRRKGIARALLEEILDRGKRKGLTHAILEVRRSNEAAQALYEALGFSQITVRKAYYSDNQEDALIMNRML